ncbi:MarR family transcriptional regulator [Nocardioides sp. HDW12B]|uniref:MarR family winged helix-turn-helix transcriptional regulator n=1 Tax=Nocardioides sp. HDW12B TaxID=2714939 RepID=UPI00140E66FC|nr:MarR family transcriptional regulator [Nocardioides sp. HDW12B]QIK64989.1 MarR family transcriptional regulator [Nocardioides sp. HDW12B]
MTRFRVDDQLCFALYDASRAIVGRYREGLAQLGLTYTQYLVLLRLWETSPLTVADLGDALNLDSGTLSPLLKRLETQGLVTRRRLPTDERSVEVAVTSAGRDLKPLARRVQVDVENATGLDGESITALRDDLHELAAELRGENDELSA